MPSKDERRARKVQRKRAKLWNQAIVEGAAGGGVGAVALGGWFAEILLQVGVPAAASAYLGPMAAMAIVIPAVSRLRDLITKDEPEGSTDSG